MTRLILKVGISVTFGHFSVRIFVHSNKRTILRWPWKFEPLGRMGSKIHLEREKPYSWLQNLNFEQMDEFSSNTVWLMTRKTQISAWMSFPGFGLKASIWKRAWDYINFYGVFINVFSIVELEFYWIIEIFWIVMFVTNFFIFQLHTRKWINRLSIFQSICTKVNNSTMFWWFSDNKNQLIFGNILFSVFSQLHFHSNFNQTCFDL